MNKLVRIILLGCSIFLFIASAYFLGQMPLPQAIFGFLGWVFAALVIVIGISKYKNLELQSIKEKIEILTEDQKALEQANKMLEQAYGYNGKLDEEFSIYSQMLGSGIEIPTANAIGTFACSLKESDSIILIKVDYTGGIWAFHVAGKPIHVNLAKWVLGKVSKTCSKVARHDSFVWKPKDIQN